MAESEVTYVEPTVIPCDDTIIDGLGSALTFEGFAMTPENITFLDKWFTDNGATWNAPKNLYTITGKQMNDKYHLTGDNAYPADLTIACIKLEDITEWQRITIPRFTIGGRWFDDVVDNNLRREEEKN